MAGRCVTDRASHPNSGLSLEPFQIVSVILARRQKQSPLRGRNSFAVAEP
jgi:hypothetical protein